MDVIACVLWIALILYIGFDTTAVYSYLRLLPSLNLLTHVRDYEKEQSERNWRMSYSLYMQLHHGGFLVNLVTCRYCLGVWLAIAASVAIGDYEWLPLLFFGSQVVYTGFRALDKSLVEAGDTDVG